MDELDRLRLFANETAAEVADGVDWLAADARNKGEDDKATTLETEAEGIRRVARLLRELLGTDLP